MVFTFLIVIPSYLDIYGVTGSGATDYNNKITITITKMRIKTMRHIQSVTRH